MLLHGEMIRSPRSMRFLPRAATSHFFAAWSSDSATCCRAVLGEQQHVRHLESIEQFTQHGKRLVKLVINCSGHRQHPALGEKGGREQEGVSLWKQAHGVAKNDAEPFGIFDDAAEPRSTQDNNKVNDAEDRTDIYQGCLGQKSPTKRSKYSLPNSKIRRYTAQENLGEI